MKKKKSHTWPKRVDRPALETRYYPASHNLSDRYPAQDR